MLTKSLFGFVFILLLSTNLTAFGQNNNSQINTIGIYGDSKTITKGNHQKDVYQLGKLLAQSQKKLIVDGQTNGLAGKFLQGAYDSKGNMEIINTSTQYHKNCPQTHFCQKIPYELTNTKETAREKRADSADMYVILPGGVDSLTAFADLVARQENRLNSKDATLDKLKAEVKTGEKPVTSLDGLKTAKPAKKPIIFLNSNHYWDNLRSQFDEMKRQNVIQDKDIDYIGFAEKPKEVLPLAEKLMKQSQKVKK